MLATMNLARYRSQALAYLTHLSVASPLCDRIAIAMTDQPKAGGSGDGAVQSNEMSAAIVSSSEILGDDPRPR